MRILRRLITLPLLVVLVSAASAASHQELDDCIQGGLERRIAACTRVLQDRNESAGNRTFAYHLRGMEYMRMREFDRAIVDFTEAIGFNPEDSFAHWERGRVHYFRKDYEEAIKDYTAALQLEPWADRYDARCWARALVGWLAAALLDCNEALRMDPTMVESYDTRGFVYLKLGQFDKAIADYDTAFKLEPGRPYALYGRGIARQKQGDVAGGDKDIAAAKTIQADIAERLEKYGVK